MPFPAFHLTFFTFFQGELETKELEIHMNNRFPLFKNYMDRCKYSTMNWQWKLGTKRKILFISKITLVKEMIGRLQ